MRVGKTEACRERKEKEVGETKRKKGEDSGHRQMRGACLGLRLGERWSAGGEGGGHSEGGLS